MRQRAGRPAASTASFGGRKRGKRREPGGTAPSKTASGRSGSSPGKIAASVSPSKISSPTRSPASGVPATALSISRPSRTLVSRVARTEASATVPTRAPAASVRARRAVDEEAQQRVEAVVVGVVDVVGLRRGEQHPVGARREQARQQRVAAGPEGHQHPVERLLELGERGRAGIDRREHVDEHDLPVDALEVVAEERPHHMRLVGLEAALHQRREACSARSAAPGWKVERREGQRRRAGEIARHQEAPRRRRRDRLRPGPQRREIGLEGLARRARHDLVGRAGRIEALRGSRAKARRCAARPGRRLASIVWRDQSA